MFDNHSIHVIDNRLQNPSKYADTLKAAMFTTIFSKKIYYEMYGAKHNNTLLYFHGGPGASCFDFVNQAEALGKK